MNSTDVNTAGCSSPARRIPSFKTVLVYENLASGERAWNFYEKLTRKFDGDFEFSHLMWSFSVLGEARTLRQAARSAADARLVILAFTGDAHLPAKVKEWVEQWASFVRDQNSALVTLTGDKANAERSAATHSYLRRIVEHRRIDFFPHHLLAKFTPSRKHE